MSYVVDLKKYTLTPGSRGETVVSTPADLVKLLTLSQLNRVAENVVGKRYSVGTAKADVAAAIFRSVGDHITPPAPKAPKETTPKEPAPKKPATDAKKAKVADYMKWKDVKDALRKKNIALPAAGAGFRQKLIDLAKANAIAV